MHIGKLAREAGFTPKTIRFYEEQGLMAPPHRTESGYRDYGTEAVSRLDFIRKSKRMGLSLEEIRGILNLHERTEPTCVHVRSLLDEKLDQVRRAIGDLKAFEVELTQLRDDAGSLDDCRPSGGRICGIIEGSGWPRPRGRCG